MKVRPIERYKTRTLRFMKPRNAEEQRRIVAELLRRSGYPTDADPTPHEAFAEHPNPDVCTLRHDNTVVRFK